MKRYLKLLICIGTICILAISGACQTKKAETEAPQSNTEDHLAVSTNEETKASEDNANETKESSFYEEKARDFLGYLIAGDIEQAKAFDFTEEMQPYIDQGVLNDFTSLESQLGTFEEISEVQIVESEGYQVAIAVCVFENYELTLSVTFDAGGNIGGLYQQSVEQRSQEGASLPPDGVLEEELILTGDESYPLGGTLTLPEGAGPFPTVILVHGSGSSNRDENVLGNTPFRDIAWGLAEQGIAVYRYDKRTYVYDNDAVNERFGLYEETVQDAAAAVSLLKQDSRIVEGQIYVAGHSLGAMAIPMIHEENPASGYIMLAGPARRLDEIMIMQYEYLKNLAAAAGEADTSSYDEAIEEVLGLAGIEDLSDDETIMGINAYYWKSILLYDQVETAKKISQPVLVLQGEEDYQVTMDDFNIWKSTFQTQDNWFFQSYPGLTHLFTEGSLENGPSDYAVPQSVSPRVITDIAGFIHDLAN